MAKENRKVDWDVVDLGERLDSEIAEEYGVTKSAVFHARRRRGILPFTATHEHRRPIKESLESRFWKKVEKSNDGCWVWTGNRTVFGYGSIYVDRNNKTAMSHRVSWTMHYGEIPEGMHVLHSCDNPPCVRPDHLFLGTPKDNSRDMISKGRNAATLEAVAAKKGEKNPRSVLTDSQARKAKRMLSEGSRIIDVARHFEVSHNTIWFLAHGVTWKHIQYP